MTNTNKLLYTLEQMLNDGKAANPEFAELKRRLGWVVLYQDNVSGRLFNFWINEHDQGHPAGCMPILVMDVFEHAFMLDYGLKRADYIEAFFKNIDWKAVEARLK